MNKNRLIALTIAAIYHQADANVTTSAPGLIPEHSGTIQYRNSHILDYLRDKEGKNVTKVDGRALKKITKFLRKFYKLDLAVIAGSKRKDNTFDFVLLPVIESELIGSPANLARMTERHYDNADFPGSPTQLYREVRNLQKGNAVRRKDKDRRDELIGNLERYVFGKRGQGEVAQAA